MLTKGNAWAEAVSNAMKAKNNAKAERAAIGELHQMIQALEARVTKLETPTKATPPKPTKPPAAKPTTLKLKAK